MKNHDEMQTHHYRQFLVMIALHFIAMYVFMYAMVNSFANVFNNVNQLYMAALMTSSMVLIELPLMRSMYKSTKLNIVIIAVGVVVLLVSWFAVRQQAAISDRQFVRSMIPHHAGAILMCQEAAIQDAEIKNLCKEHRGQPATRDRSNESHTSSIGEMTTAFRPPSSRSRRPCSH